MAIPISPEKMENILKYHQLMFKLGVLRVKMLSAKIWIQQAMNERSEWDIPKEKNQHYSVRKRSKPIHANNHQSLACHPYPPLACHPNPPPQLSVRV